jgi:hypothetical protein
MTDVLTFHNDMGRTGQTLHEEVLNPGNVNTNHFGKLWSYPTDEKSYAEPLYVAGVQVPGQGMRNVIYIATENDSVYAYNADGTNLFWKVSLCAPGEVPYQLTNYPINPEIGITSTPVIDRNRGSNGAIYVVAESQDASANCYQRIHALDLASGDDLLTPQVITARYPGKGDDSTNGTDYFVATHYVNRAALLLLNGTVYVAWSVHANSRPGTSWIMGYDEQTLAQTYVCNMEPNGYWGSIWNSGGGPAADPQGNIYVALGNASQQDWESGFDTNGFPADGDFGCSLVKLSITNGALKIVDYFAPSDIQNESYADWDLGSSCPVVLPDMVDSKGVTRQLVIVSGKDQSIFLADRTSLGKCNLNNNNALYQLISDIFPGPSNGFNGGSPDNNGRSGGMWSIPAYFNGSMYFGPNHNTVKSFPFIEARLGDLASQSQGTNGYPGATPSISADVTSNGIVWTTELINNHYPVESTNAILHVYASTNLGVELFNSTQATNNADRLGAGQKYNPPMIASGRVYVASTNSVVVYGLLDTNTLTPIQAWRNAQFGNPSNVGSGANSACPAGDGVPNIVKYALGLNPLTPAAMTNFMSASLLASNGQQYLTLSLSNWANPTDISLLMGISPDLLNWSLVSNFTVFTNAFSNLIIGNNQPFNANSNSFMRLQLVPAQ